MSLLNGWTGGQYSLYRFVFGGYLFTHFVGLLPWGAELFSSAGMLPDPSLSPLFPLFPNVLFLVDGPAVVAALLALGAVASLLLAVGLRDRIAAVVLWYVWACLFTRNPLISNPSLPFVGWLLLAHAVLPRAPYGAWEARGRSDPGGGWRLPPPLFAAAWILMALSYSYSGYTKLVSPSWVEGTALARVLDNPLARPGFVRELLLALPAPLLALGTWGALALELCFAPLALFRRLRPWLWLALLGMHLSLMVLIDFADLSFGMVVLHFFTFDPAWARPRRRTERSPPLLFYDGACGLCHRAVRFVLAEDRDAAFRFAPIASAAFERVVPEPQRAALPDSVVLLTPDGRLLSRSRALVEIGRRLGGLWWMLTLATRAVPASLRDSVYDRIASVRHRVFARPDDVCPVLPPQLRERFET